MAPDILDVDVAAARVAELWTGGPARLVGSGAPLIAQVLPGAIVEPLATPDAAVLARLAAGRESPPPPRPLYLRAPDAKIPGS